MRQKPADYRWKAYVLWPLAFAAATVALLGMMVGPTITPYVELAKYMFSTAVPGKTDALYTGLTGELENNGTIGRSQLEYPEKGDLFGNLSIAGTTVDAPLYYGDASKQLNKGVGLYVDSSGAGIPGEGKTILAAGHNTTFFNGLQDVKAGDIVSIDTNYGRYAYKIAKTVVAKATDTTVYDFSRKTENLILYTCYPFDAFGLTPQRFFVYADYVSGPQIDAAQ